MAKAAKTTTSFQKMGMEIANGVGVAPALQGTKVKKVGEQKGGMIEAATANHRANINEKLGATCHPQATLYAQNAAEASQTQRNTYIVPSKAGFGDFNLRKRYSQGA
jgi:hypothetical protein